MSVTISKKTSRDKQKVWYYIEWGKAAGQRIAAGIFTYTKPKDQLQKNHNKESLNILEAKKSQMILDKQAIGSGYIPQHKIKSNFLDYYEEHVKLHARTGNRHLKYSLKAFRHFMNKDFVSPGEITETLCERFRAYLLSKLNGETPSGYFMRFKKVLKAAQKDGYFRQSPAGGIAAKTGSKKMIKQILTEAEYIQLIKTPCLNHEIKKAYVVSLYAGLRWADVKPLDWKYVQDDLVTIVQTKTGKPLDLPLHPIARQILGKRKEGLVFKLPSANGANKILGRWCDDAGINKHITWHCARHSFSVLLQLKRTDVATIAGMLGHTSAKYVQKTYQRYIREEATVAIQKLPSAEF